MSEQASTSRPPDGDPLADPLIYASPEKFCDLVMKGGITSGVAYPRAVCELARTYSLKSIGGASAGAIAAAAAAAAEYQRRTGARKGGGEAGYALLAKLPGWLADDGNLAHLFQANEATAPLYNVLTRSLELKGGAFRKTLGLLGEAWRNFPAWALAGAGASLLLLLPIIAGSLLLLGRVEDWPLTPESDGLVLLSVYTGFFSLLFVIVVASLFVAVGLIRRAGVGLAGNYYGLTTGLGDREGDDPRPVLTSWLADEIDAIAGKPRRSAPLTFGDLRGAVSPLDREWLPPEEWGVRLQVMTTNLTLGRPYRLPFDDDSTEYFYDPEEWARFFPSYIMKWLADHPRQLTETTPKKREEQAARWKGFEPLLPLPAPEHMPVVVAARMSLSFPILISAVPLRTVDRSRVPKDKRTGAKIPPRLERCLFSDGGVSSNFPIHFFDRPLPRWPTFGINLQNFHPDFCRDPHDQSKNSYLVRTNEAGRADAWDRFEESGSAFGRLAGFLGALVNTMYNWADNAQVRVPGYRDRVVHIFQDADEGGLNLNMPSPLIRAMSERGRFAGVKLRERFTGMDGSPLTWDNHRWIRYRSIMSLVEELLRDLRRASQSPVVGDAPYETLIGRGKTEPPAGYPLNESGQRELAVRLTRSLLELAAEWEKEREQTGQSFSDGAPRPAPELRIRPRI